jgi:hypothetical protein
VICPLEKLVQQPQGRPAVASALNQQVEDLALVIDSPPEVPSLSSSPMQFLLQLGWLAYRMRGQ